jgi:hypothetical protein
MNRHLERGRAMTRTLVFVSVAAALAVAALGGATPSRASVDAVACTLASPAQLRSIIGFSQSIGLRDYDGTAAASEDRETECGVGLWSGAAPTSTTAMFAMAKSGHGAQVAILTWAPHGGSPDVHAWVDTDYHKLTSEFLKGAVSIPGVFSSKGLPAHTVHPPHLGHGTAGFTAAASGQAKGLTAAIACWWNDKTSSAICVFDEEAAFRPTVQHLYKIAAIVVPKFL